jgi:serralysin
MANLVAGANYPFRMDQIDITALWDGVVTERSSSKLTIDLGGGFVEHFTGFGVAYDGFGNPGSGTITGLQETYLGNSTFTLSGLNTSAAAFNDWVRAGDTLSALFDMFAGNDSLTGSRFNDFMGGLDGHDNLIGGEGADSLFGGAGNDHLYGQSASGGVDGADSIGGGDGSDYLQGNAGNDMLDGGNGSDRINGGADNDNIIGGAGNDTVNGNLGNDSIDGGFGGDFLRGGKGDDLILGGDDNDILLGDLGNDTLEGGHYGDVMTGGDGADVFRFDRFASSDADWIGGGTSVDEITDFTHGIDHINLEFVPTSILTGSSTDLTDAIGDARELMIAHAGYNEVAIMQVGGDSYLVSSGAGMSDFADLVIELNGVNASMITAADFI